MDSGLLTIIMVRIHRTFWSAAATLPSVSTGIRGARRNHGVGQGLLARRRFGFSDVPVQKALRPGESAVAAAQMEPDAQISGKRCEDPRH